jgi:hypothetical protein
VSGNPNDFHRTLAKWMNIADYTQIAPGTYGDAGRNSLLGPGGYEADLAVFRDFRYQLREKPQVMEFRLEAFNATNHPEFSNPSGSFTSAQFGKIRSTANTGASCNCRSSTSSSVRFAQIIPPRGASVLDVRDKENQPCRFER